MAYTTNDAVNYCGIGKQTVFNTGVPPTLFVPYKGDVEIDHAMEGEDIYEGGVGPVLARSTKNKHSPKGKFLHRVRPSTGSKLMAWFLGADAISGAGPYVHTLTPTSTPIWVSVETNQSDVIVERFVDGLLSECNLKSGEADAELEMEVGWMALTPSWTGSATVDSYESGVHGVTPGGPFKAGDATFKFDNATITNVVSWELALTWNVEATYLSRVTPGVLAKLRLGAELKVVLLESAATPYRTVNYNGASGTAASSDFYRGTSTSFQATYDNGMATTNNRKFDIQVPAVAWKAAPRKLNSDGETSKIELSGVPYKDTGALLTVAGTTGDAAAYI